MEATLPDIPEEGELVTATVRQITPHGVYVSLDEYGGLPGFLHISEISTGWVRSIDRYVQQDQKIVLKVIRVGRMRREVDLSLRQVTSEERKAKLIEVKRTEKAKSIIEIVRNRLNLSQNDNSTYAKILSDEFGGLYEALEEVAKKGVKALEKLNIPSEYASTLETVAEDKIKMPEVYVMGVFEITSHLSNGMAVIKENLRMVEGASVGGAEVKVSYIGSPRYRVVVKAENYKTAEKALEATVEKVKNLVEKSKGTFKFTRGEAGKKSVE